MASHVSLISQWFVRPGREVDAVAALKVLAKTVEDGEPDTLTYLVHSPLSHSSLQSLPPVDVSSLLFFETYRSAEAFHTHVNGPVFKNFVSAHGDLFLQANDKPYTAVHFLERRAGFVRESSIDQPTAGSPSAANRHPAVMFEIIAKDQTRMCDFYARVFGWHYREGTGGFAYIHFPIGAPPLLGGIGSVDPTSPGFDAGRNFYLLVDDVEPFLQAAYAAGGRKLMQPTAIDGYRIAMFLDPEDNPIGLIEPFAG